MITHKELTDKLIELDKLDSMSYKISAARDKNFYKILSKIDFNIAVEIGTYQGLSAVVLASKAKMIYTFDVYNWGETDFIWNVFGIRNKIKYFVFGELKSKDTNIEDWDGWNVVNELIDREASREKIKEVLKNLNFDLAFIDGRHDYKNVKADFEIVKKCGKVLFHDYAGYVEIKKFCDEIGAKQNGDFAYYERV